MARMMLPDTRSRGEGSEMGNGVYGLLIRAEAAIARGDWRVAAGLLSRYSNASLGSVGDADDTNWFFELCDLCEERGCLVR